MKGEKLLFMFGKLLKNTLLLLTGFGWLISANLQASCDTPQDLVIDKINESMLHHALDAVLENSRMLESAAVTGARLVIGEMSILKDDNTNREFTFGVWLLDTNNELTSLSGNAKAYSRLPEASLDMEMRYYNSGDLQKVRACMFEQL